MRLITCLFSIALAIVVAAVEHNDPIVKTALGNIRGKYLTTKAGRSYAAFEGIPYAKPPVKKYRFREPRPIRSYHSTIEARFKYACLQYNHYAHAVLGEEDCLYINLYVPQINNTSSLPVVIFIHGGAFMFGSGFTYGEKFLMDKNVIYATFNYRLGPLGFLSTEDAVVPGNNGMKDQVLALKWIHTNIQYFGGDPSQITLTGMSAGGASVHLHYLSPLSVGLFTRGFSLSGTALNPWVLQENARQKAFQLATLVECPTNDTRTMINCLSYIPARTIVETVPQFLAYLYNPFSPFGPVVEPQNTINPFLSSHPYKMLKAGQFQNLPWFTSVVESEGLYPGAEFWPNPNTLIEIDSKWNELAPHIMDYNHTLNFAQHPNISTQIKNKYLNGEPISKTTFSKLIQMLSDRLFVTDAQTAAKIHASVSASPVHFYYYKYRGAHSKSEALSESNENFGASHGDDTVYVLSSDVDITTTKSDVEMQKILMDLWMSYAVTGVPTLLNSTWDTVSKNINDPLNFIEIQSPNSIVKQSKNFENVDFWLSLPFKENHNLYSNTKDEL